jgi:MerR family mercuric resistance operon transcriptional regulator
MTGVTIGKIAKEAGVGIETVRFYERQGLIDPPPRTDSGYRLYPADTVAKIRFIRNAKQLGFSLKEIAELLTLHDAPNATKGEVKQRTQAKIAEIETKIMELTRMKKILTDLAASCSGQGSLEGCPIMKAMEGQGSGRCHS